MLNNVNDEIPAARTRVRMPKDERRRQLVGIGLRMLTERPIQDVSLDSVAAEAGISRGLLFHYFPTKTAFYEEVVAAAGRRVLRNVTPDDDVPADERVRQILDRYLAQIDRRRDVYLALVQGNLGDLGGHEVADTLRGHLSSLVTDALDGDRETTFEVVHAWFAYVEDRAIAWSALSDAAASRMSRADLVTHCERALDALLTLDIPTSPNP